MINAFKNINKSYFPGQYYFGPEWIVLGVNNVCNLHCKMCDIGNQNLETNFAKNLVGTKPLNMPESLCIEVINQVAKFYPKSKIGYAFTEPLVYPYLEKTLKHAHSKGLFTALTTNALLLKTKAEILAKSGLNQLYVSLDGPEKVHNEIRGNKKSFQKAIEGIIEINQLDPNIKVSIICALTEWNIGYLEELLSALKVCKITDVGFMHTQFNTQKVANYHNNSEWGVKYPSTPSNVDIIDFSNMDLEKLFNEIEDIRHNDYGFNVYFSPDIKSKLQLETYYNKPEKQLGKLCQAVFSNIMIKSDGSVIPAHGRCYDLNIGNIYNTELNAIWKSEKLKQLRVDLDKAGGLFPSCSRCCSAL